jgi:hypothetical protein
MKIDKKTIPSFSTSIPSFVTMERRESKEGMDCLVLLLRAVSS